MKVVWSVILFLAQGVIYGNEVPKFTLYGKTSYTKQSTQSLVTTLNAEYSYYFHKNLNYALYFGGKVSTDMDHFGNEIKTNVFTVIGIDF